jgi:hypothetical protein
MFRDRRQRHRVPPGQARDAAIALRQLSQDPPPGRIGQRGKGPIQYSWIIFNHLVKYLGRVSDNANEIFAAQQFRFFSAAAFSAAPLSSPLTSAPLPLRRTFVRMLK